ncbi:hypothetical protein FGG08_006934 [Glutinoglossum americanum]|uniref:Heterokaryon incompatibility domain-containing protein n=1 Tax=Glutinoglossum americanum TaxID=1670608 RepID=A0A9P8HXA6_9PEZI|nr:hypothetical protein FGG08_006934 [Glutinoglossum americanum]
MPKLDRVPISQIQNSALSNNCPICSLLLQVLGHFVLLEANSFLSIRLSEDEPAYLVYMVMAPSEFWEYSYIQLGRALASTIPALPHLGRLQGRSTRPDAPQALDFIHRSLTTCTQSHPKCIQPPHPSLPKRLLQITNHPNNNTQPMTRLIETIPSHSGKYATLSHCWGGHQPLKTTTSTLPQHKQNIPWSSLPPTFQNALTIADSLAIPYLWIDSLCILQDSKTDWEIESPKMCSYYSNAYLTLAAASSPNPATPFLSERDPDWHPALFPLPQNANTNTGATTLHHHLRAQRHMHSGDPSYGPLSTRGWVWQESVLSTRALHFTERELLFVCRTGIQAESDPRKRTLDYQSWMKLSEILPRAAEDPCGTWCELVTSYSDLRLTFESDRLPALSGVASQVSSLIPESHYLAGLWSTDLSRHLCWSADAALSKLSLPAAYIAPSWSWASVCGPVYFLDKDSSLAHGPKIQGARCTVPGQNPFGEVSDGFVTVVGLVMPVTLHRFVIPSGEETRHHLLRPQDTGLEFGELMIPDVPLEETTITTPSGTLEKTLTRTRIPSLTPLSLQVHCLYLGTVYPGKEQPSDPFASYGMVLGLSHTASGAYTRLGLAMIQNNLDGWFGEAMERIITII